MNKTIIIWVGSGLVSLIMALVLPHFIRGQLVLTPYSRAYKMWENLPVPIYMDMYVYHWVNAEEFRENPTKVKPFFKEVGPFVYEEAHGRVDVSWSEDGSTIAYNITRTWKPIPEESADITVNVTNLNCLALTVAYMSRLWTSDLYRQIINVLINKYESLFVTAPAENWLFNGITHDLLEHMNALRNVTDVPIPYEKFGWFYNRNGSALFDGRFQMYTGSTDLYKLGYLVKWNNMNKTNYYENECAEVKGVAGELMPPVRKFQEFITMFSPDLCSYVSLKQNGTAEVEGLQGNLYESDESVFDNGESYPENSCFCLGECSPRGARNVSACKFGSPAFVSFPHFHLADSVYTQKIDGLAPDKEKHDFRIKVDPITGIPLEVHGGIQVNVLLRPYNCCDIYKNLPELYIPMLWFRQRANISSELAFLVKVLHFFMNFGSVIFFVLAASFTAVGASLLYRKRIKKTRGSLNITNWKARKCFKPDDGFDKFQDFLVAAGDDRLLRLREKGYNPRLSPGLLHPTERPDAQVTRLKIRLT